MPKQWSLQFERLFETKIYMINSEISKLNDNDLLIYMYLLLAIDDTISFYFAIFINKIFTLSNYIQTRYNIIFVSDIII